MSATTVRGPARSAALDRTTAMRLAATEYQRFLALLRALDPDEWALPTDCPAWDVRAMAAHVLGMAEMVGSMRQQIAQGRAAARRGGGVDALTDVQVRARASLSAAEIVDRLAAVAPRAVRGRRLRSVLMGRLPFPEEQVIGDVTERWTFGYLMDVILTRDPWMHRVDIARATGHPLELTAEADGVLVDDIVREWAGRHGQPYRLRLTGPAGGSWSAGEGGPELELDAVEFCRLLSGRGHGTGLLAQEVPF